MKGSAMIVEAKPLGAIGKPVPWADISKVGSSLADLATRSAGDLSSGNLPWERMPTGAGTWSLSDDSALKLAAGKVWAIKDHSDSTIASVKEDGTAYFPNRVGIGTADPTGKLTIANSGVSVEKTVFSMGGNANTISLYPNNTVFNTYLCAYSLYSILGNNGAGASGEIRFYVGSPTYDQSGQKMVIKGSGNVGIRKTAPLTALDIHADVLTLDTPKTPASAGDAGNPGDICWDASYVYVCIAGNAWKRAALSSW